MTHGTKWLFSEDQTYGFAIAGSNDGIEFAEKLLIQTDDNEIFAKLNEK